MSDPSKANLAILFINIWALCAKICVFVIQEVDRRESENASHSKACCKLEALKSLCRSPWSM